MDRVPVLILAWRRPDRTALVLEAVARYRPAQLFLACDGWGPTTPPEVVERIRATRAVLERALDWPCDVQRLYAVENLGGPVAVPRALDWFFEACPEGIILEDDCLPHPDFFGYCEELLARYRDEPRVMSISGDNSPGVPVTDGADYAFIRWPLIWGWATWRRAWQRFEHDLDRASSLSADDWARRIPDATERRITVERLGALRSGSRKGWDHTWALTMLADDALSIHPRVNLVTNIGIGRDAEGTHTIDPSPGRAAAVGPILPLSHPAQVALDEAASTAVFDIALGGREERRRLAWERSLGGRIRTRLHRALGHHLPAAVRRRRDAATPVWLR